MNNLIIHTGNIINWKFLKNQPNTTVEEEVIRCSLQVIKCCIKHGEFVMKNDMDILDVSCERHKDCLKDIDRNDIKIVVKIFLYTLDIEELKDAVEQIINQLGVSEIDTLILSLPSTVLVHQFVKFYEHLEGYVISNTIHQLGVCDLSFENLEQLCKSVMIRPAVNHVNSKLMCSVSQKLKDFANENHIQLLTHNDGLNEFPTDKFKSQFLSLLERESANPHHQGISYPQISELIPHWLARYSVSYANRGVIRSRGYCCKIQWK